MRQEMSGNERKSLQDLRGKTFAQVVKSHDELKDGKYKEIKDLMEGKRSANATYNVSDYVDSREHQLYVRRSVERDEAGYHVYVVKASGRFEDLMHASIPVSAITEIHLSNSSGNGGEKNNRRVRLWSHLRRLYVEAMK